MKKSIFEVLVEPHDILQEELKHIKGGISPITSDCTDGCNNGKIESGNALLSVW